jgi:hypothetical protein
MILRQMDTDRIEAVLVIHHLHTVARNQCEASSKQNSAYCQLHTGFLLGILLDSEE